MSHYEDLLVDALLDCGFSIHEAFRLIALQEQVERERKEAERQRDFGDWLREIGGDDYRN